MNRNLYPYLNCWEEESLLCSVLYTFIVDWQSWNSWKLMFLKCQKDFSLQLAYRTKQLDISPEIPPDLSKAVESFFLIWEKDKPLRPTCINVNLFCLVACSVCCGCLLNNTNFSAALCCEIGGWQRYLMLNYFAVLMIYTCAFPGPTSLLLDYTSVVLQ